MFLFLAAARPWRISFQLDLILLPLLEVHHRRLFARLLPLFFPGQRIHRLGRVCPAGSPPPPLAGIAVRMRDLVTPTGVVHTNVGMPVSWQMGPSSSTAISTLERMMSSACEDWRPGVSWLAASDIAARTSARKVGGCPG